MPKKKEKSTNTFKNRHIGRGKDKIKYPGYEFPDLDTHKTQFCSLDDIYAYFVPTKVPSVEVPVDMTPVDTELEEEETFQNE